MSLGTSEAGACVACEAGKYGASGACIPCPTGSYSNQTGRTACTACSAGYAGPITGATTCQTCPTGRYTTIPAQPTCQLCPVGTFSSVQALASSSGCLACGEGAASAAGSSSCISCTSDTFPDIVNGGCVSCPANSVGTTSLDGCICDLGHFHSYNAKARGGIESYSETMGVLYKHHSYPDGSGTLIVVKPVALTMTCNGEPIEGLYETGTHVMSGCAPTSCETGMPGCAPTSCETGMPGCAPTSCETGMPGCALVASYVVDERFSANETYFRCKACPPGFFSDLVGVDMCSACPAGTYQDAPASAECLGCPAGSTSVTDGATLCDPCPPGQYQVDNRCEACPTGSFSSTGVTECVQCDENTWSNTGASSCNACPYWSTGGGAGAMGCKCQDGTYLDLSSVENPFCRLCGPGMFAPSQSNVCLPCNSGTFNDKTAQVACEPCALNASAGPRALACTPCAVGETRTPGRGACMVCPQGWICLPDGRATKCQPGKYGNTEGLHSLDQCSTCPENMVCRDGSNAEACPPYTRSAAGSTSMQNCLCDNWFECVYIESTRVKVLLPYTIQQFDAMRPDFIQAVAEAAGVGIDRVKITYVEDISGREERRSLWSSRGKEKLVIRLRVAGKLIGTRRLDSALSRRGIRGSMENMPNTEKRDHHVSVRK
jgi:hypothetical protein